MNLCETKCCPNSFVLCLYPPQVTFFMYFPFGEEKRVAPLIAIPKGDVISLSGNSHYISLSRNTHYSQPKHNLNFDAFKLTN